MCLWKKSYMHGETGTIVRWTPNLPTMFKDPKLLSKVNMRKILVVQFPTVLNRQFYPHMG